MSRIKYPLIGILFLCQLLSAQDFKGTVISDSGEPLKDAKVELATLVEFSYKTIDSAITDEDGNYELTIPDNYSEDDLRFFIIRSRSDDQPVTVVYKLQDAPEPVSVDIKLGEGQTTSISDSGPKKTETSKSSGTKIQYFGVDNLFKQIKVNGQYRQIKH